MKKVIPAMLICILGALIYIGIQQKKINDQLQPISKKYEGINKAEAGQLNDNIAMYKYSEETKDTSSMISNANRISSEYRDQGDGINAAQWEKVAYDLSFGKFK
jgi:hypothetical protein